MYLNEVQREFELSSRTHQTVLLGGGILRFVLAFLIFSFAFFKSPARTFNVSGYREAFLRFSFFLSMIRVLSAFPVVFIRWADYKALESLHFVHRYPAQTSARCARSPIDFQSPHIRRTPRICCTVLLSFFYYLFYWSTAATVPSHSLVFQCAYTFVRPGQFYFAFREPMFRFRLPVESLFFFFVFCLVSVLL